MMQKKNHKLLGKNNNFIYRENNQTESVFLPATVEN